MASEFSFRRQDRIGYADADSDKELLSLCFVDSGDLEALRSTGDPRRIILARTGGGKTALLLRLEEKEERVIRVQPETLSLPYIANSTILNHVRELGADLGLFFKMLWRHVFVVEIIKQNEKIRTEEEKNTWFAGVRALFSKDPKRLRTLEYMDQFGSNFWKETDVRVKEITQKIERDIKAELGSDFEGFLQLGAEGKVSVSQEKKIELAERSQKVVNQLQIQQLSSILDLLQDLLSDRQKKYFVVIDRLDEDWVEDALRYELIRALIETVSEFKRVRSAKIVVAMREDLLERVFRETERPGFQREKLEDLLLRISWQKQQLEEILDKRITALVRRRYEPAAAVRLRDVLAKNIDSHDAVEYLLERTLLRPRDAIAFLNACIAEADGSAQLTAQIVKSGENAYSKQRLEALRDEWRDDYPNLSWALAGVLAGVRRTPTFEELAVRLDEFCLARCGELSRLKRQDELSKSVQLRLNDEQDAQTVLATFLSIFYRVGAIGLRLQSGTRVCWSYQGGPEVAPAEISDHVGITIHFAFCCELRVNPN